MGPFHTFEEHGSDVRLRVEAPTLRELFEESGRGLAELTAAVDPRVPRSAGERVALHARDCEALLVGWLNELIFRSETRKRVYDGLHVDHVGATSLEATVRGRPPLRQRTSVKAATMHAVRVAPTAKGYEAVVVFDV